jgi:energy-coupling factor transporter ATP-binding protein EcfA2
MAIKELLINIKNCYGISNLEHKFQLANKNPGYRQERTIQIYAPNGTMKTSLTKCFKDYYEGIDSIDRINNISGTKSIKADDNDINKEQILVIDSYIENYESTNISRLLINQSLKKDYNQIETLIKEKEDILRQKINSHLKDKENKNLFTEIINYYNGDQNSVISLYYGLKTIKNSIEDFKYQSSSDDSYKKYSNLNYAVLFDEKVFKALDKANIIKLLGQYFTEYKKLVNSSEIFRFVENGVFDHLNADEIRKSLHLGNFFNANHSINLSFKKNENHYEISTINSEKELSECIEQAKKTIEENPELQKTWAKIEKTLGTYQYMQAFTTYIKNHIWIIEELNDLKSLQKKVITSYFLENEIHEAYNDYMQTGEIQEPKIKRIREQAANEKTRWEAVVKIFKTRFNVPYGVSIDASPATILGEKEAVLNYSHGNITVNKDKLIEVLSEGEKRTLYLLNIIFDLLTIQEENKDQDKIVIIDDIIDSFDYKNKHAILEYIYDTTSEENIYLIMLTHSFDFYRSVANLFQLQHGYIAEKTNTSIILNKYERKELDPCKEWLMLNNNKDFISSIALFRNLCDYLHNKKELKDAISSKILHYPIDEDQMSLQELLLKLKENFSLPNPISLSFPDNKSFLEIAEAESDELIKEYKDNSHVNLQDKIILSITLRLLMEKKLIKYLILKNEKIDDIKHNQTRGLINKFKKQQLKDSEENTKIKGLLDIVNIISANHIHINSFMYEPLMDINGSDLMKWYKDLKAISLK